MPTTQAYIHWPRCYWTDCCPALVHQEPLISEARHVKLLSEIFSVYPTHNTLTHNYKRLLKHLEMRQMLSLFADISSCAGLCELQTCDSGLAVLLVVSVCSSEWNRLSLQSEPGKERCHSVCKRSTRCSPDIHTTAATTHLQSHTLLFKRPVLKEEK